MKATAKLPKLPKGWKWHNPEALDALDRREGWRPLLDGERSEPEDEFMPSGKLPWTKHPGENPWCPQISKGITSYRTKRPLPTIHPNQILIECRDLSSLLSWAEKSVPWMEDYTLKCFKNLEKALRHRNLNGAEKRLYRIE